MVMISSGVRDEDREELEVHLVIACALHSGHIQQDDSRSNNHDLLLHVVAN